MESTDATGATRRALDLRADLTARLDVETLLAEASAARQAAVVDADEILAQAQQVSEQLLQDSRAEAHSVVSRARAEAAETLRTARADGDAVRQRAEAQVEEHRRRVRAEVTEQVTRDVLSQARAELALMREQSVDMIGDLEASVQILGVSLETARTNVGDMLARLDGLRAHTAESLQATGAPAAHWTEDDASQQPDYAEEPEELVGAPAFLDLDDPKSDGDEDPPRTATEAYLRSAHIDFGDPPLPPADDAEVAARYVRDAVRRPAGPRALRLTGAPDHPTDEQDDLPDEPDDRGDEPEDPDVDNRAGRPADGDQVGTGARPLGWLFRSPS